MTMEAIKDLLCSADAAAIPIVPVRPDAVPQVLEALPAAQATWARAQDFAGRAGELLLLPDARGNPARVLAGLGDDETDTATTALQAGALARRLPAGDYHLDLAHAADLDAGLMVLGWLLSAYRPDRALCPTSSQEVADTERKKARLAPPPGVDVPLLGQQAAAIWMGRDLVNTPANRLGPAELAARARDLAEAHGAALREITGDELARDFPLIHAVGRGAEEARAPRLIDLAWNGDDAGPRITLVGKGVCFDTGGLDIKPASAMRLMKKDMGGAATALACARMIMASGLPVRLRVLIPAVENAVSGRAFRPGDVWPSRGGLSVEIGNTDAEGRLVLADALSLADEEKPDLLVDFATLTGAARVALGPDLPPVFSPDESLAEQARKTGRRVADPVWPLPLHRPYMEGLKSDVADISNITNDGFAGSITAALFLSRFVKQARRWLHFDIYGWNPTARPARPKGGEVQAARLVFHLVRELATA